MALFIVDHTHASETCPAGHPKMGPMLLKHVAPRNAEGFGVKILGDAVVDGGHRYVLIVDAESDNKVRQFMDPFFNVGSVEIWPASSCERLVARGRC